MTTYPLAAAQGRGPHLASRHAPGQCLCQRRVLHLTGQQGTAKTPRLCENCRKAALGVKG